MSEAASAPPGYFRTVALLLRASSTRAAARRKHARALHRQRTGKPNDNLAGLIFAIGVLFHFGLHASFALLLNKSVVLGEMIEYAEQPEAAVVVHDGFMPRAQEAERFARDKPDAGRARRDYTAPAIRREAAALSREFGGDAGAIEAALLGAFQRNGIAGLVAMGTATPGLSGLQRFGPLPKLLGSIIFTFWMVFMCLCGVEPTFDPQARRFPAWEFLFSHPAPPGAILIAEMLTPIVSNAACFTAPTFAGLVFGLAYGPAIGLAATVLVGVPLVIAVASMGKAFEITAMLKCSPRSRGAALALLSSASYIAAAPVILYFQPYTKFLPAFAEAARPFATTVWLPLPAFLGAPSDGVLSLLRAAIIDLTFAASFFALALQGARLALSSGLAGPPVASSPTRRPFIAFGSGDPALRKELLWFLRDRGAIVHALVVALALAGLQLVNLRGVLSSEADAWNGLCTAAIVFGAYILMQLGPKSLASEGQALWIAWCWPLGLEKLLRGKARFFADMATCAIVPFFLFAAWQYPEDAWKITGVGIAWYIFARAFATKSVTLANVPSENGETRPTPVGRRSIVNLGVFSFALGVGARQWDLAAMGVGYCAMSATAIWSGFRARLPFLQDPWSERLPTPPTLVHAMVAISCLAEGAAAGSGFFSIFTGSEHFATARAWGYGLSAIIVCFFVLRFLQNNAVSIGGIFAWSKAPAQSSDEPRGMGAAAMHVAKAHAPAILIGIIAGVALGLVGRDYVTFIRHAPFLSDIVDSASALAVDRYVDHAALFTMAVVFAPPAEEFLFRGLLFRALDKEWGGARAILASAGFFALYHPLVAWPLVIALGALAAILYKRTGSLVGAMALHVAYNAIVAW